jgi:3-phenylpropionate/trans-cinnamate dioxygenase ferredoxin reductase component
MKYLIIGGGIAGTTAAGHIRKEDPKAQVTIIDAEQHRLYSRVLIPHYVKGMIDREKIFLKKEDWYGKKGIELMSGVEVLSVDTKNKFVATSEGRELPFDKLLVTTGGDVRLYGEDKRGVSYLRTLDDADQLIQLINETKDRAGDANRAIVYGGGFITLEFINIFAAHKIPTTVVMRGSIFGKHFSREMQDLFINHLRSKGVEVLENQKELTLLGKTEVEGVRLTDGREIPTSILGVGIGSTFEAPFLEGTGVEIDGGIKANVYLETTAENIYTAGDVANFEDEHMGRFIRYGNWMTAQMQARVLGKTMTGTRTKFDLVSSLAINVVGMEVVTIGDSDRGAADAVRVIASEDGSALEVFDRSGVTVGAAMLGDVSKRSAITKAIKEKVLYK